MEFKHVYWVAVIQNIVAIVGWIVLAVMFNKWWIALFGLLFIANVKNKNVHRRICDGCGEYCSVCGDTAEKATEEAKKIGWYHAIDEIGRHIDYCPECRKKYGV